MPPPKRQTRLSSISLDQVSHRYANGTVALAAMDVQLRAGEFVSVLGPSGCGKSTLLRLLAGLEKPSSGLVNVPSGESIGFVFQAPTLMPWASVAQNVALPLRINQQRLGLSNSTITQRVNEQLVDVGLADFAQARPSQLSGGMQMRVAVARALVTRPSLLLMDEPFAALDEITRQRLADDLLAQWQRRGFTVLFVTHNVFEAAYLSQRVLVMSARPGRVCADIRVDAPERGAAFRRSAQYLASCTALSMALEQAMGTPAASAPYDSSQEQPSWGSAFPVAGSDSPEKPQHET